MNCKHKINSSQPKYTLSIVREPKAQDQCHEWYPTASQHIQFSQQAMLRLNCTASRLLGWVRSKEDDQEQTGEIVMIGRLEIH